MPIGACDHCRRWFVVEDARSPQRTCPHCFHPMRLTASGEALDHLREEALRQAPPSAEDSADGVALAANELGQRLLKVVAEAAAICGEAEICRQEARELRERLARARKDRQTARERALPPAPPPELGAAA
jgi:hypothetical protein